MAMTLRQQIKRRTTATAATTTRTKKPPRKKIKLASQSPPSKSVAITSVPSLIKETVPLPPAAASASTDISADIKISLLSTSTSTSASTSVSASASSLIEVLPLPEVCLATVFSFASSYELSQCIPLVCKNFNSVAIDYDNYLWKSRCENLWKDKVKTSYEQFAENDKLSHHQKYIQSVTDSKRCDLTAEELCTYSWAFRFKAFAGNYWMDSIDPYWIHLKQIAVANNNNNANNANETENINVNAADGTNNNNDNNNNSASIRMSSNTKVPHMVRRFKLDGNVHSCSGATQDILEQRAEAMNMDIKWKLNKSRTWQNGAVKKGYYLSCGRTPSSGIERNPKDWGWIMQNQLVAFVYPSQNLLSLHNTLEKDIQRWI